MTDRQTRILFEIVEQYAEVKAPVGSLMLAKIFGVSSATIRSEMAKLEAMGFIHQPHTSAGRVPTDKGYRFYVNQITEHKYNPEIPAIERSARAIEVRIESNKEEVEFAVRSAADSLVELTGNLALATIDGHLHVRGISYLFNQPEFSGGGETSLAVARLLDNLEPWLREAAPKQPLNVYIGEENPIGKSSRASLIISKYNSPYGENNYVGVLGPTRQSYARTMKLVKLAAQAIEEVI